ncbi:hypothetical protein RHGRI_029388 [Rhododendron griersonianum]|uniref:Uncharacterized protein n=1 Tax=Rhododendron griersonianum TaxID=479676 RepID=A0AAV6IJD5_9ERIC|nr:hypothetical protein RHGRI_029388 [Rhododendron griersonianum]
MAEQRYLYASNEQFFKILKSTLQLNLNVIVSLAEVCNALFRSSSFNFLVSGLIMLSLIHFHSF